jgi:hypothetical protein
VGVGDANSPCGRAKGRIAHFCARRSKARITNLQRDRCISAEFSVRRSEQIREKLTRTKSRVGVQMGRKMLRWAWEGLSIVRALLGPFSARNCAAL